MQRVAAVKHTFTVEDVYERASRTLEKCIRHGATRMRTHLELDGGVEMRSFEAIEALRRDYAWAIDIEVCVFPQEGLTDNPRADALLVEGLKRGAQGDRRGAELRSGPCRADPSRVRPGARVRCGHRHASRFRQFAGRDGHPSGLRADREVPAGRAGRGRAHVQAVDHAGRRSARAGAADRRCRRGGDRAAGDRAVHDGPRPGIQRAPRRGGREPAGGARRELLAVHQQRAEPVHAVSATRSLLRMANLQANVCQISGTRAAARVLRHADRAFGAADEPEGLRHQGRQSRRHRGAGCDDAGAGGGGDLPSAGGVQARAAHGDAAARAELHSRRDIECGNAKATDEPCTDLPRQRRQPHRLHDRRLHRSVATAGDASAAACRDGVVEALVRRGAAAVPALSRGAHGPARPRRIAGAAAGTAAVDGPAGAGRARTARSPRLRRRCTSSATPPAATWRRTWRWHRPSACAA